MVKEVKNQQQQKEEKQRQQEFQQLKELRPTTIWDEISVKDMPLNAQTMNSEMALEKNLQFLEEQEIIQAITEEEAKRNVTIVKRMKGSEMKQARNGKYAGKISVGHRNFTKIQWTSEVLGVIEEWKEEYD